MEEGGTQAQPKPRLSLTSSERLLHSAPHQTAPLELDLAAQMSASRAQLSKKAFSPRERLGGRGKGGPAGRPAGVRGRELGNAGAGFQRTQWDSSAFNRLRPDGDGASLLGTSASRSGAVRRSLP